MVCSKKECLMRRKNIIKNTSVEKAMEYLEQCEACCYRQNNKQAYEIETYAEARLTYVSLYWQNRTKNTLAG